MKLLTRLPNNPKIIVGICFGEFWICNKMLSHGRLTINFSTDVFTHTRWLFSYGATFLPDARGNMLFYSVCELLSLSYTICKLDLALELSEYRISIAHSIFKP